MIAKPKHSDLYITNNSIIIQHSIYHNVFAIFATIKPIIKIITIHSIIFWSEETQVIRSDRTCSQGQCYDTAFIFYLVS